MREMYVKWELTIAEWERLVLNNPLFKVGFPVSPMSFQPASLSEGGDLNLTTLNWSEVTQTVLLIICIHIGLHTVLYNSHFIILQ